MKLRSKEENWESEMVNRTVKASFMVMGALAAMIDWWKENVGESVMLQCEIWSSEEHERECDGEEGVCVEEEQRKWRRRWWKWMKWMKCAF